MYKRVVWKFQHVVGVGWFESCGNFCLRRITCTKKGKACNMGFSSNSGVWEDAVRGKALVDEFGVGVSQATCALDSFVILGEGGGQKGFDEIGKLGMPYGKVQTHALEGSWGQK